MYIPIVTNKRFLEVGYEECNPDVGGTTGCPVFDLKDVRLRNTAAR